MRFPRATYRVQLNGSFDFDAAASIADYLAELGVSDLYASPYLQAAPGSAHGYDVVDHSVLNPELGGEEAHRRMCAALQGAGLSQVVDVVPNHMAIGTPDNRWWWDVLEHGQSSSFASYFDVDWNARGSTSDDRILLPVLGDQYGRVVESGDVRLQREGEKFVISYYERTFPVTPRSLSEVLARAADRAKSDELAFLAGAFANLPEAVDRITARRRTRDTRVLHHLLARALENPRISEAIEAEIDVTNLDADALDSLLAQQNYRLAYWQTGRHELEYRRFFDIDNLVGLHMEDEEVFEDTHRLMVSLVEEGVVTGLRIDHPDGLRDPKKYLAALRRKAPTAWIVVEKILEPGEQLPDGWPVAGTTGYEYLRLVGGLFLDPPGLDRLLDIYREAAGRMPEWETMVRESKGRVLDDGLRADLDRLVELLFEVCEHHRRHRDHSRLALREALRALLVCFPVYRTYMSPSDDSPSLRDREYVEQAVRSVKELHPRIDVELLDWLQDILLLRYRGPLELELALRFQQLSGPAMAKGVEDTAFYRFHRLISANEVGGDPINPATSVDSFHGVMAEVAHRQPQTMLTTSTHDTKRSEDVRARLAVLSEIPDRWRDVVAAWFDRCARYRGDVGPDRNTEYLLYQTVVGAWPIDEERAWQYMQKAIRESKTRTAWTRIDEGYEGSVESFVRGVLSDEEMRGEIDRFVQEIKHAGRLNALAQTALKLVSPGVPDIYQGTELWDLSLVDPDNRRPVDFDLRRRLLSELAGMSPEAIMERMDEGLPKLWIIRQALALRRERPEAFERGSYAPVQVEGMKQNYAIAFSRGESVVLIAPRLTLLRGGDWGDTSIALPDGRWDDVLTGEEHGAGSVELRRLLARFPVALLSKRKGEGEG